jgi:hypothetical protein
LVIGLGQGCGPPPADLIYIKDGAKRLLNFRSLRTISVCPAMVWFILKLLVVYLDRDYQIYRHAA